MLGFPLAAVAFSLVIFVIDAFVNIHIAIAVLYVGVVLLSLNFCERTGILAVTFGCISLAVLALVIQHGFDPSKEALARLLFSVVAITITGLLIARISSTTETLRDQAELLDLTHDAIFVRNMNDVITYWNRGAEKLYGWTAQEALGKNSRYLTRTSLPAPYEQIRQQLFETGHWEGELVHYKRDGTNITVASRWSLQRDERGVPAAILESNTNIEDRKVAQEKLMHAQSELAHVVRVSTLGELTASIAHEVNQPLAAIVTSGEACLRWLANGTEHIDRVKLGLERIIQNGQRASDVVRRLRALAKKDDFKRADLDLNEIIEDTLPLVQREILRNRISLTLTLAPNMPLIQGDRIHLQQVIINLLVNAIQAMSDVAHDRRLVIETTVNDEAKAVVSVRDNGHGFAPDQQNRLFGAFFTTKTNGMGMGLSISRSIIDAHGGRIWASLNEDGGATFRFCIPTQTELVS